MLISLALVALDVRAGQQAAERARKTPPADFLSSMPVNELHHAQSHLAAAHDRLSGAVFAPLRLMPVVGRQLESFGRVTDAASQVGGVSADAVAAAQALAAGDHNSGPQRVQLLRGLSDIATKADARLARIGIGSGNALIWPASSAHDRLKTQLRRLRTGMQKGRAGASATADLLDGPRRYLVLAANNAEMRAGSGMFLSAGVLETGGGRFGLSDFQSTVDLRLPGDVVPLEGDLAARWGWLHPNEEWRNLGVSPRFDVTAPLAAKMWEAHGGGPVDGVLALDAEALRAVLVTIGPVAVDGQLVDATNVVERVLHGQYFQFEGDVDQSARREELGKIAKSTVAGLEERSWNVGVLGSELGRASRGRHLMAWSSRPTEQEGWAAAGIDGAIDGNSMLVAVLNRGGNKLDRFLDVKAGLELHRSGAITHGVLRVQVRNQVPSGEPNYVSGPLPESVPREQYAGILAVTLPGDASGGRIDGENQLVAAGPDGPSRVVAAFFTLGKGQSRSFVVRFELSEGRDVLTVRPSGRLPAVAWSRDDSRWSDDTSRAISF
ncbi:MAG: DUF4012 domain-containing protein [Actinomycetota bacterium]|nr:DUF4012 domain-containing protein [Actinomycetota bacterium]